jgi:NTP pyrophosphatase (non-canonical NTP hydrolase)
MEMKELIGFIETEDRRLKKHYNAIDEGKHVLARTVKLTEELGELCNDVLAHSNLQRKEKLGIYDKENTQEEFADVIITTMLLAKAMGIDVERGLESKIEKINKRYE